jgi:phosphonate transport system substrate-binding protein
MIKSIFILFLYIFTLSAKETLYFGAITTVQPEIVKKHLQPLLDYLSEKLDKKIIFSTGLNYDDTIDKFVKGIFDLGYIGPSPYVLATRKDRGALRLLAGIETNHQPYFYAIIIARKDSNISKLEDLKNKKFAFGSRRSTLSFYLPFYMLEKKGLIDKLRYYDILGRHDIVAKNVIMGNYDAGGVKESVAWKYRKYLKRVAVSEPIVDFAIVAHSSMDRNLSNRIQELLLNLKDKKILNSIKKGVTGFVPRDDSDYDNLRKIMNEVEKRVQ